MALNSFRISFDGVAIVTKIFRSASDLFAPAAPGRSASALARISGVGPYRSDARDPPVTVS